MAGWLEYVKAYYCPKCDCGWTIEAENPEVCWICGSEGPHEVMATSRGNCKFVKVHRNDEDYMFTPISELGGDNG